MTTNAKIHNLFDEVPQVNDNKSHSKVQEHVIETKKYKTTDGRIFDDRYDADAHQAIIDEAERLVQLFHVNNNSWHMVSGSTYRGHGLEVVKATNASVLRYTINLLENLAKQDKYFSW